MWKEHKIKAFKFNRKEALEIAKEAGFLSEGEGQVLFKNELISEQKFVMDKITFTAKVYVSGRHDSAEKCTLQIYFLIEDKEIFDGDYVLVDNDGFKIIKGETFLKWS